MPDILDENGLTVKTLPEIIASLDAGWLEIFPDANISSNSPDGQIINLVAQEGVDARELIVQVNNGFDPDRAVGSVLDERVVINNIERRGGTFTIVPITLVINQTVTLQGLDAEFNSVNGTGYTVQDDAGNKFILVDTATLTAGTYSKNFRAQQIGRVETTIGTIVNQVTIVLGVASVNNPSGALEIGQNEETDAELRVRRQQSVSIASTGYLNGLLGAILALDGVSDAVLYENYTDAVDGDGIPAHGIWLVVEGGANSEIADTIYGRKSYGANMRGAVSVPIITASGGLFEALFDRPTAADLFIRFDIQRTRVGAIFDSAIIKQYIVDNLSYNIGQFAETSSITSIALAGINSNGGGGVPVNVEISISGAGPWVDYLEVSTLDKQWTLDVANIAITVLP